MSPQVRRGREKFKRQSRIFGLSFTANRPCFRCFLVSHLIRESSALLLLLFLLSICHHRLLGFSVALLFYNWSGNLYRPEREAFTSGNANLMSQPSLGVAEGQRNASVVASSASTASSCHNYSELKEHNYMEFSDCSSVASSAISNSCEEKNSSLNLKATELRLGLPGSSSLPRDPEISVLSCRKQDEKPLFPLPISKDGIHCSSQKTAVLGNKRWFSDAMDGFSEVKSAAFSEGKNRMYPAAGSESETAQSTVQGKFSINSGVNSMLSPNKLSVNSGMKSVSVKEHPGSQPAMFKEAVTAKVFQDNARAANDNNRTLTGAVNSKSNLPAAKAQVVGWPPIRSFRKNTLAATSRNNDEVDGKPGPGGLFVKVSMDGAPYLRKVDLRTYSGYQELSSALEKMFSCFTIGQCGSHGAPGREMLSESKLKDLLHGSENVLTYEDKDGDWMLVGDVPWEMFINSCKRLRIMKSSDAIGLAPRAVEKCQSRN